ncbi:MAG: acyl-CoA desaturase [Chloroflexi bacterium]|nr:acyl-CoA desaturase [Chloroflexota bacterium]
MLKHLFGEVVSAEAGKHSSITLRVNQGMATLLLTVPLAFTIFALTRLVSHPPDTRDLALLGSFYVATALGITVGFHRMLTHGSFETNPLIRAVLLIFGTWAIQGAAITWSAIHSKHHVFADTDQDPHSPVKNFWHGHMGWFFGTLRGEPEQYAKAQLRDPVVMFISRTAFWWAVLGMVIPFLIGGWSGLLWGGAVRLFLVHHVTFSVNSICHYFGSRPFDTGGQDVSRNNWVVGVLAMGEGWHNNHHAFPKSSFQGLNWRQIDLSGQFIRLLGFLRLARGIYTVPPSVVKARLAAQAESTP